ncbi:division/cell wall cluster transcriptional repressor MraZ [Mycoplasmoides pirum]|uniref:division/cell wall cluster transcriptional repressor MraZ n=1 Tax=Mycoplasmoides pirum TaxID=2122 RepID=UPI0004861358|nr:division/cell wall cluster transcriptional repressor MraZ [Mycoplasmoides pirum]
MFLGTFEHSLDAKNRISLPSRLRSKISSAVVVSKGFDGCLEVRTPEDFENYAQSLNKLSNTHKDSRIIVRQIFANSTDIELDASNRILIPANLLKEANLKKDIVIIGAGKKMEIWDKQAYEKFKSESDEKFEEVAERLNNFENEQ